MSTEEELYNYYFSDELLSRFSQRFSMNKAINELISLAKGKNTKQIDAAAKEVLGGYLQELSTSLAKSEKDLIDHTGEIIYQVAEKTGFRFPSVPQRLIELGFMGTRPQDKLSIIENNPKRLVLRISTCAAYSELRDKLGEEKVRDLPCRHGCLANSKILLDQLNMTTHRENTAKISEEGYCEFTFWFE